MVAAYRNRRPHPSPQPQTDEPEVIVDEVWGLQEKYQLPGFLIITFYFFYLYPILLGLEIQSRNTPL